MFLKTNSVKKWFRWLKEDVATMVCTWSFDWQGKKYCDINKNKKINNGYSDVCLKRY